MNMLRHWTHQGFAVVLGLALLLLMVHGLRAGAGSATGWG